MASSKILNMRQTRKNILLMKTQKEDWDGFQVKPPRLRRKEGSTTGKRLAEPAALGPSTDQLKKWISRRSQYVARRALARGQMRKSVPQRQTTRPCPVLTCGNEKTYYKVSTQKIEKSSAIVVPSAHDLTKQSSELSAALLVTWLGIIAYGKTVHARGENVVARFDAAARTEQATIAFSPEFCNKHSRIVKEFKAVAGACGSSWTIANGDAKHSAATPVANADEFRQFLLTQVREPRIAGLDWSLGTNRKHRWTTRFGTPLAVTAY